MNSTIKFIDTPKKKPVSYLQYLDNCKDTVQNAPKGGASVNKKNTTQSNKHKDKKGRVLRKGESQRPDGRYQYRYTDSDKVRHCVYDLDLDELRKKEAEIQRQLALGLNYSGGNITVQELLDRYLERQKMKGKRENTECTREFTGTALKHGSFGSRDIRSVRTSEAEGWLVGMYYSNTYKSRSIESIKSTLKAAFQMAVNDDILVKNPFDFRLDIASNAEEKFALDAETEQRLFGYMSEHKHFKKHIDTFRVLLEIGVRVSELCGLTIGDLDFEKGEYGTVAINKQLQRSKKTGELYISPPKTERGYRVIPLSHQARQSLKQIIADRPRVKVEPNVDGYFGFLFLTRNGTPKTSVHIENALKNITQSYNKTHAVPLPHIVPHTFRHTFCTRLRDAGVDMGVTVYLMGHKNPAMVMKVYDHVSTERVNNSLAAVNYFRMPDVMNH